MLIMIVEIDRYTMNVEYPEICGNIAFLFILDEND